MHRLSRQQIEILIAVTIATAPPLVKSRLRSKLTSDKDWARGELARMIAAKLDNDGSMVVVADTVGLAPYQRRGSWGVDEEPPAICSPV